jgi:phage tail-like protein
MSAFVFRAPWFAVLAVAFLLIGTAAAEGRRGGSGPLTIKVEIEGVTQGLFDVVEGLESRSEVLERDDDNPYLYPAPGPLRWSTLVLKRSYDPGLTGLWNWRRSVIEGSPQRRDGRILLFDAQGRQVACWVFTRGWPSRWEVGSLRGGQDDPGTELVEIVHEGLRLEGSGAHGG